MLSSFVTGSSRLQHGHARAMSVRCHGMEWAAPGLSRCNLLAGGLTGRLRPRFPMKPERLTSREQMSSDRSSSVIRWIWFGAGAAVATTSDDNGD
jgi:hypothetical protein